MTHVAVSLGSDVDNVATDFQVSGLVPFTTAEWAGKRAAVVLAQGCPWRCGYCFQPGLQDARRAGSIAWDTVMSHLHSRGDDIDAVVFSGGEPTRQLALQPAMREVRDLGLQVGLQSAGAFPGRLHDALQHADWLALDIKSMPEGYQDITTKPESGTKAWASLEVALAWGGPLEVRVTVDPTIHTREIVLSIVQRVRTVAGLEPVVQEASAEGCTEEFRAALAGRRLTDVLRPDDLPHLTVRR